MALAVLARDWAERRNGTTLALVVDHGLRPTSAGEARVAIERLACLGIPARLLPLSNLKAGPALAERARIMRYEILTRACREAGILHLLLGHHAADQIETVAMRVLRGSQTGGLAGMSAVLETDDLRLLRPLLGIEPAPLRSCLTANDIGWIDDPSNYDLRAMRPRLRRRFATGRSEGDAALGQAVFVVAKLRMGEEAQAAAELARRATIRPEGFALLSPGRISPAALSSLIQTIGGSPYPPNPGQINALATQPGPASLAGVRIVKAGRFGEGLLIVREEAAVMGPVAAYADTSWDNRFRLVGDQRFPAGATIGKLGDDAARFRRVTNLPSVVLRTLPAVRLGNLLASVPHLGYARSGDDGRMIVLFAPPRPASGARFVPTPSPPGR
jgi:tRNA(Ile)-lysidine synthase